MEALARRSGGGRRDHAREMLEAHPRGAAVEAGPLIAFIEACLDCAQSCTARADACVGEADPPPLVRCIRTCLDCADLCAATGRVLSRRTDIDPALARAVLQASARACQTCGEECCRHADHHEHCRVCAEACRRCEAACAALLSAGEA